MPDLSYLKSSYEKKKDAIRKRLLEFKEAFKGSEEDIFAELCFCLLTPQSKAKLCWHSITKLKETRLLYTGDQKQIKAWMGAVRFNENKSRYIIENRGKLTDNGEISVKHIITMHNNPKEAREWLAKNIKGYGYKEASHFLRNIGFGNSLSILDRHILKNLVKYGVIKEAPKTITSRLYIEIENKMEEFAKHISVPMDELDLLFWSEETGDIFK